MHAATSVVYAIVTNPGEDASTQMNLGWHADIAYTGCFVTYTRKSDTAWANAVNLPGTYTYCDTFNGIYSKTAANADFYEEAIFLDYGAILTGLQPDTEYMYKVGNGAGAYSAVHYFKTAGAAEFSFVWISDFHAYAPLPNRLSNAIRAINAAVVVDPSVDFIFSTGDTMAWGGSYSFWTNMYAQSFVHNYMFANLLGNHDNMTRTYTYTSDFFRLANHLPLNGYSGQAGVCYWFIYHNVLFLTLNNEVMKLSTAEETAAKNWAAQVIQSQQGRYRYIFLCEHYQWFYAQDGRTSWYANWRDFCDQYGVDLALSGNNHIYLRTYPLYNDQVMPNGPGTVYMQTPSSDGERGVEAGTLTINTNKIAYTYSSHTISGGGQVKTIGCVLVKVGPQGITTKLIYLDDNLVAHVADESAIFAAPQITTQPQDRTALAGESVVLTVAAAGSAPLSYQWRFYGTNLAGATASSLNLGSVTTNHSGPYTVVATNPCGAVTSQVATLTVRPPFQVSGWSQLWSLAPGARPYLTTNALPGERGMAYNPASGRLILVNRTSPTVHVLDADTGADLWTLDTTGVTGGYSSNYYLLMVGVADDGAVYAANLTTSGATVPFKLYRWANDSPNTLPTVAYSGDPGAGNSQRWGDTLEVRGAGVNTQVILASRHSNLVALLTTANGTTFTAKLITVADAPVRAFGLGLAFGAGKTFWGKATAQDLRQVSFDLAAGTGATIRDYADPVIPTNMAPIGVHPPLNLLAGINVGVTGNHLRLYDLTPANGTPVFLTATNFASDNDNTGSGTGAVDFSNDRVYALGANNGLVALQLIPPRPQPGRFDAICHLPDSSIQLAMTGTPGTNYLLQWSGDLNVWSNLCTVSASNGAFWTVDPTPANTPRRFYRLRLGL